MKKTLFSVVVLAIALVMGTMMSCSKEEETPAMTVEELNAQIENLTDSTVAVQGTVEGICHCTGTKLKFEGAEFVCVWDSTFDSTLVGKQVRIEGVVCEKRISAEEIDTMVARFQQKAIEDSIAAAEAPVVAEAKCEKQCEGQKCEKHAEGECAEEAAPAEEGHKCCGGGHCEMNLEKALEMQAECAQNGLGYVVVGRYIQVTAVKPVVEEEAK